MGRRFSQMTADEMTGILKISVYLRSIHFMSLQLILDHYKYLSNMG